MTAGTDDTRRDVDAHIAELVANAPPLSDETIDKLVAILRSGRT